MEAAGVRREEVKGISPVKGIPQYQDPQNRSLDTQLES